MSPRRANLSELPALRSVSSPIQPRDTGMPSRQGKSPCLFAIFDVSISLRLHADAEPVTEDFGIEIYWHTSSME